MKKMISPSMMCADVFALGKTLETLENKGIEFLHIDIMDGCFVPNFTLGTDYCKALKSRCSIPLDIHLMLEKPEEKLGFFTFGEGDIVSVHTESTAHLQKALSAVRQRGAKAFAALNPATPLCVLEECIDDIDGVLIMAVNPGFAGQKMIPSVLKKIEKTRNFLNGNGRQDCLIEVDGNVSFENAVLMKNAGADIFVAGTSSVFAKNMTLSEGIDRMREVLL